MTNVLEGIRLVEKKSKNTVHWCGARNNYLSAEQADLHTDLADLEAKENEEATDTLTASDHDYSDTDSGLGGGGTPSPNTTITPSIMSSMTRKMSVTQVLAKVLLEDPDRSHS
jgi:hypothetical protein